eukprot:2898627-Rhodomonas_salina.1
MRPYQAPAPTTRPLTARCCLSSLATCAERGGARRAARGGASRQRGQEGQLGGGERGRDWQGARC